MEISFSLNNKRVENPLNVSNFTIELNFDRDNPFKSENVSVNEWEFGTGDYSNAQDGATVLDEWFNSLPGPLEGCPFKIELKEIGKKSTAYNGIVDTSKRIYECNKMVVPSIETGGLDWFNEASKVSFDYLGTPTAEGGFGNITSSDYIMCPYTIETSNGAELFLASFTMGSIVYQIVSVSKDIAGTIASLAGVFTFGNLFMLIVQIAFAIFLVVSFILLFLDILNMLIQPVKYFASMYAKVLCQKACEYLGFTFESSVLLQPPLNQLAIIPPRKFLPANADIKGVLGFLTSDKTVQNGYYQGTFQALITGLKSTFGLKEVIDSEKKVFRLEPLDFKMGSPLYKMPDVKLLPTTVNREEYYRQINFTFTTDNSDRWTVLNYEGTEIQVNQLPVTTSNRQAVLNDGLLDIISPFARGTAKTGFTGIEQIVLSVSKLLDPLLGALVKLVNAAIPPINTLINLINKLIKALNKIPKVKIKVKLKRIKPLKFKSLAQTIEDRLGMLKVESDYFSIHKMVLIPNNTDARDNRLLPENSTVLHAKYIWDNFLKSISFDPLDNQNNQRELKEAVGVTVCYQDYLNVKDNSFMEIANGQIAEIISFLYKPKENLADIKFKIQKIWVPNLTIKTIIPNGS